MRDPIKYFEFNKEADYLRGSGANINILNPGMRIKDKKAGSGIFFSRILDSREKKTKWHRLIVEGSRISEAPVKFRVYTSDIRVTLQEGISYDIGELLADPAVDAKQKQKLLEPYLAKTFKNPEDVLLFGLEGRYLWFMIELGTWEGQSPEIKRIKIYFPKNTWLEYLPEVYQLNKKSAAFTERFLGVYQSLYQDMTRQIETVSRHFDPDSVEDEVLRWLAGWFSIDDCYVWDEEQLRYLVRNAMSLYAIRGTLEYLIKMIFLYTGRQPFIIEHHRIEPFLQENKQAELIQELYGDNKYIFTVILGLGAVADSREFKILTKIIENAKPAHMESNIVVLEPFIFLDKHSYLGVNSILGQYQNLVLDGQAAISFTTIS